jgi:hypothetical protein
MLVPNSLFARIFNILPNGFYYLQPKYTEQFILNNKYLGSLDYEYCNISKNRNIRSYYIRSDITITNKYSNKMFKEIYQYSFNEFQNPPAIYRTYCLRDDGFNIDFKNLPQELIDSLDKKRTITPLEEDNMT